jgi:hypothetical protein
MSEIFQKTNAKIQGVSAPESKNWLNCKNKGHFLDSMAEIHPIFGLFFWKI